MGTPGRIKVLDPSPRGAAHTVSLLDTLGYSNDTQVHRGSTFALRRSTLDFCLGALTVGCVLNTHGGVLAAGGASRFRAWTPKVHVCRQHTAMRVQDSQQCRHSAHVSVCLC